MTATPSREQQQCQHLRAKCFRSNATLTFDTHQGERNHTDYAWALEVELCELCSGYLRAALSRVAGLEHAVRNRPPPGQEEA